MEGKDGWVYFNAAMKVYPITPVVNKLIIVDKDTGEILVEKEVINKGRWHNEHIYEGRA